MNRKIWMVFMLLLLLPVTGAVAGPGPGGAGGCGPGKMAGGGSAHGQEGEMADRQLAKLSKRLNLSAEQREKVGNIFAAEAEKTAPLRRQMMENRAQLHQAVHSGAADENTIRGLAAAQGQLKADLLVSRAQSWQKIHELLTPEQQDIARNAPPGFPAPGERPGPERERRGEPRE